ncbi:MAG: hypothetical protein WCJ58_04465 [bacterium]
MKQIYQDLWTLAKPYYQKGQEMDLAHIEWMLNVAEDIIKNENLAESIFLPLIILHDLGYSQIPDDNPFQLDLRKAHLEKGAKLAGKLLKKINYPEAKIKIITNYIAIHDNWAFGEHELFINDRILGVFSDLDFVWMASEQGFLALRKILNKSTPEMISYLKTNEKLTNRPFSSVATKELFESLLQNRAREY